MAIMKKRAAEAVTPEAEKKPAVKAAKAADKAVKSAAKTAEKAEKKSVLKADKPVRKAAAPEIKLFVEYQGRQVSQEDIVASVRQAWDGKEIKSLEVYVKPEDGAVYYVVNGADRGRIDF